MAKFEFYQMVRVVRAPSRKDAAWLSDRKYRSPKIGDTGAVVEVYLDPREAYCVEAVAPDGKIEWLVDFLPDELESA
jgi:hypothetical protein